MNSPRHAPDSVLATGFRAGCQLAAVYLVVGKGMEITEPHHPWVLGASAFLLLFMGASGRYVP